MSVDMATEPVAKVTETHSVPIAASIKEVRGEEGSVSGDNGDSSDGDDSGGVMGERGGEVNDEVKKRKKAKKKKGKAEKSWKECKLFCYVTSNVVEKIDFSSLTRPSEKCCLSPPHSVTVPSPSQATESV